MYRCVVSSNGIMFIVNFVTLCASEINPINARKLGQSKL